MHQHLSGGTAVVQVAGQGGVNIELEELVSYALHVLAVVAGKRSEVGVEQATLGQCAIFSFNRQGYGTRGAGRERPNLFQEALFCCYWF